MPSEAFIPRKLQAVVGNELQPGERVLWAEQPRARFFANGSWIVFLFAIPWTGFALFWICAASGFRVPAFNKATDLFPLFGLPFVVIGLAMLSVPFWARRALRTTVYVVTDRRAIIVQGGGSLTIRSYRPEQIGEVYRRERRNGRGDVIFSRKMVSDSEGTRAGEEIGFRDIVDPKAVEARIRELAQKAGPPGQPSSNVVTP